METAVTHRSLTRSRSGISRQSASSMPHPAEEEPMACTSPRRRQVCRHGPRGDRADRFYVRDTVDPIP
jgi:hypothetical protein